MAQASVVTSLILGVPVISIFVNRHLDTKIEEARRHDEVTEQLLENRERLRRLDEKVTQLHENRERLRWLDEKVEHLHGKLDEIDHILRREGGR